MMNYWILFAVSFLFSIGIIFIILPFFQPLALSALKQVDILLDDQKKDDEKDKAILKNTAVLVWNLIKFLLSSAFIVFLSLFVYSWFLSLLPGSSQKESSLLSGVALVTGGILPFYIFRPKSSYGYWSQILHHLVLDNFNIGKFLFRREVQKKSSIKVIEDSDFVIVSGLARSGTTAMTQRLYETGHFYSTKYASMPFLMAPKSWKRIYNPKPKELKERAHGDSIYYNENSIEALDEYFFKLMLNDSFIKSNRICKHEISEAELNSYLNFMSLFADDSSKKNYLSKNNNFMLRYESIRAQNKKFKVVLMFRHPIDHCQSLIRQHNNFILLQSEDPFTLTYMNWLGHHEFGQNQKPFEFDTPLDFEYTDKTDLNYWIQIWINYYSYILQLPNDDHLILIEYKDFLESPAEILNEVSRRFNVTINPTQTPAFIPKQRHLKESKVDNTLHNKANDLFSGLQARKLRTL